MHRTADMISREQAFGILDKVMGPRRMASELVSIDRSYGRVLAQDVKSMLELPPFDRATMDGYALPKGDLSRKFKIVGTVQAGQLLKEPLRAGTAVKIMTGAPAPSGSDRVVRVEYTRERDGYVEIEQDEVSPNISPRGVDVKPGDVVLKAGTKVGAVVMSNLAACAVTEVQVVRKIRIVILSTGDEIVDHPKDLEPGKIVNSNGPLLASLARANGMEVLRVSSLADQKEATREAIREASENSDLVVLSGGVSMGEYDYVLEAFEELKLDIHFSRLAVKPGKPTVFCTDDSALIFGLPGNPVSVFVMFHLFVLRAVAWLNGAQPGMREFEMQLGRTYKRKVADRLSYVPSRINDGGTVEALDFHGSAHQSALIDADGFFQVPLGCHELAQGSTVKFMPLRYGRR